MGIAAAEVSRLVGLLRVRRIPEGYLSIGGGYPPVGRSHGGLHR